MGGCMAVAFLTFLNVSYYILVRVIVDIATRVNGMDIVKVNEEKDLGVLIDCNLKFHGQCSAVINKANRLLGIIKQKKN